MPNADLDGRIIRKMICDYLISDPYISSGMKTSTTIKYLEDIPLNEYVNRMRSTSEWGGGPEIKAFVNLTGIPIWIRNIREKNSGYIKFDYDLTETKNKPIPLKNLVNGHIELTWSGGHYERV